MDCSLLGKDRGLRGVLAGEAARPAATGRAEATVSCA
jgi:hypothetical protein